jgi:ATP adenylyltransferase
VEGFTVGINDGQAAGRTIFHCYTHLTPRRRGAVEDSRSGVRRVIPGKGFYRRQDR